MSRRAKNRLFNSKNATAKALLMRRLLLWSGIGAIAFILLLIIAWYQVLAYLQSGSFRHVLEQHMETATGAQDVNIRENIHIDGERISEEEIRIQGLPHVEEATIARLSMEIDRGAILDRQLHVKKLLMEEASLSFYTEEKKPSLAIVGAAPKKATPSPTPSTTKVVAPAKKAAPAAPKHQAKPEKQESAFSIRDYRLEHVECSDLNIKYRHGKKEYSLSGSSVKATPISGSKNKHWQIHLENGRVHLPFSFLRDAGIHNAYLTYNGRSVDMSECRFMLTPGEMRVKAHYNCESGNWRANLQINKSDIDHLLKNDWKKRISGELFGKASLNGTKDGITHMDGVFSLRQGVLEGLPFLSEIRIGNTQPYRTIRLSKSDCRVSFPYNNKHRNLTNAWLIDKIDVRAENGQLRILGHVIIAEDQTLGGTLTFGVPQSTLSVLPIPESIIEDLFNAKGDAGYVWVNMNLSGTLEHPEEDLSVRLTTILQSALPEAAGKVASSILQNLFHVPTPAEETSDEEKEETPKTNIIQQATDGAGDLLKGGLRAFF